MKKLGKPILYILSFIIISSFLINTDNDTIDEMVSGFDAPLNNFISSQCPTANPFDTLSDSCKTLKSFFWNIGHLIMSLIIVLIFYLGFDKKVWKS